MLWPLLSMDLNLGFSSKTLRNWFYPKGARKWAIQKVVRFVRDLLTIAMGIHTFRWTLFWLLKPRITQRKWNWTFSWRLWLIFSYQKRERRDWADKTSKKRGPYSIMQKDLVQKRHRTCLSTFLLFTTDNFQWSVKRH